MYAYALNISKTVSHITLKLHMLLIGHKKTSPIDFGGCTVFQYGRHMIRVHFPCAREI